MADERPSNERQAVAVSRFKRLPELLLVLALVVLVVVRVATSHPAQHDQPRAVSPIPSASASPVLTPLPRNTQHLAASALHGLQFDDVTRSSGLAALGQYAHIADRDVESSGLAYTELHGDAAVLMTFETSPARLVRFHDGRAHDVTHAAGLAHVGVVAVAVFADVTGDGIADLVVTRDQGVLLSLYRGTASGRFVDATRGSGFDEKFVPIGGSPSVLRGLAVGDVNGDGRLDVLSTDWNPSLLWLMTGKGTEPCPLANYVRTVTEKLGAHGGRISGFTRLFIGTGDGHFADRTGPWGLYRIGQQLAYTPQFVDLDGDGRLDLVVTGDVCTSGVYRNTGSRFVEVPEDRITTQNAMGSIVRDFNGDGKPDWLTTSIAYPTASGTCPYVDPNGGCDGNQLYLNTGGMGLKRVAEADGLGDGGWAWGVAADDFTNLGGFQVAMTNGYAAEPVAEPQRHAYYARFVQDPMSLFVRDQDRWVDVADQVGITDTGDGHGLLAFDYNHDGRLDVLVNDADSGPHLYENVTPRQGRHWVDVRLRGRAGNTTGLGARVRVIASDGRATDGWVTSGGSYETGTVPGLHVGLGSADGPATVKVWWPGGRRPQMTTVAPDGVRTVVQR